MTTMYPPFEFNNLLGPLIICVGLLTIAKLLVMLAVYKQYLKRQDAAWMRS